MGVRSLTLWLQVLALFGACDDDGGGSLDYFEFIEKVLDGIACRPQSAPKRKFPKQVHQYRQQQALCDMFKQLSSLDNVSDCATVKMII